MEYIFVLVSQKSQGSVKSVKGKNGAFLGKHLHEDFMCVSKKQKSKIV